MKDRIEELVETDRGDFGYRFRARLSRAGSGSSMHSISVSTEDIGRLTHPDQTPEQFVRDALTLFLDHEKPETLPDEIDLREMISFYPGFQQAAREQLGRRGAT